METDRGDDEPFQGFYKREYCEAASDVYAAFYGIQCAAGAVQYH